MHEGHDHPHPHSHTHETDKSLALLTYMLEHNRHHAQELHELAHSLSEKSETSAARLHEAVALFQQGNDKLQEALQGLKEEK